MVTKTSFKRKRGDNFVHSVSRPPQAIPADMMKAYQANVMANRCRYIAGDMLDGTATFCDGKPAAPSVYCRTHRRLCENR